MARRKVGPVTDSSEGSVVGDELARRLVDQAQPEGVQLKRPGGCWAV
jgi:hypothetical protein